MKTGALAVTATILAAALALSAGPAFAGSARLTGNYSTARQSIDAFAGPSQPPFCGVGWELVLGRVGLGGEYDVSFTRPVQGAWWLDWYTQPLFVSWHPFRTGSVVDPFVQAGVGCAGRVFIDEWTGSAASNLQLSIFPFVAGGLALDLSGFLLSGKVAYVPFMTAPPATVFSAYPLGNVQVTIAAGIAVDW